MPNIFPRSLQFSYDNIDDLQSRLQKLGSSAVTKKTAWIGKDLLVTEASIYSRILYFFFGRTNWFKNRYGIDLNSSQKILSEVKFLILSENKYHNLLPLFNAAVNNFNQITSEQYHIDSIQDGVVPEDELHAFVDTSGKYCDQLLQSNNYTVVKSVLLQALKAHIDIKPFLRKLDPTKLKELHDVCEPQPLSDIGALLTSRTDNNDEPSFTFNNTDHFDFFCNTPILSPSRMLALFIRNLNAYPRPEYSALFANIEKSIFNNESQSFMSFSEKDIGVIQCCPFFIQLTRNSEFDIVKFYESVKEFRSFNLRIMLVNMSTTAFEPLLNHLLEQEDHEAIAEVFKFCASHLLQVYRDVNWQESRHKKVHLLSVKLMKVLLPWSHVHNKALLKQELFTDPPSLFIINRLKHLADSPDTLKQLLLCFDETDEESQNYFHQVRAQLLAQALSTFHPNSGSSTDLLNWIITNKKNCLWPDNYDRNLLDYLENSITTIEHLLVWFKANQPDIFELLCNSQKASGSFLYRLITSRSLKSAKQYQMLVDHVFHDRHDLLFNLCQPTQNNCPGIFDIKNPYTQIFRQALFQESTLLTAGKLLIYNVIQHARTLDGEVIVLVDGFIEEMREVFGRFQESQEDCTDMINLICSTSHASKIFCEQIVDSAEFNNLQFIPEKLSMRAQLFCLPKQSPEKIREIIEHLPPEVRESILHQNILVEPILENDLDEPTLWPLDQALLQIERQLDMLERDPTLQDIVGSKISEFIGRIPPLSLAVIATEDRYQRRENNLIARLQKYLSGPQWNLIIPVLSNESYSHIAMNSIINMSTHIPLERASLEQKQYLAINLRLDEWMQDVKNKFMKVLEIEDNNKFEEHLTLFSIRLGRLNKALPQLLGLLSKDKLGDQALAERVRSLVSKFKKAIAAMNKDIKTIENEYQDIPDDLLDCVKRTILTDPIALAIYNGDVKYVAWISRSTMETYERNADGLMQHPTAIAPVEPRDFCETDDELREQKAIILTRLEALHSGQEEAIVRVQEVKNQLKEKYST